MSPSKEPTPEDYKRERQLRGTQVVVAAMLDVHPVTIAKRETGAPDAPITREAWLALTSLPMTIPIGANADASAAVRESHDAARRRASDAR